MKDVLFDMKKKRILCDDRINLLQLTSPDSKNLLKRKSKKKFRERDGATPLSYVLEHVAEKQKRAAVGPAGPSSTE